MLKKNVRFDNFTFYKYYHQDRNNVLVHIVCIPAVIWSMFGIINNVMTQTNSFKKYILSFLIYIINMLYYYMITSPKLFLKTFVFYLIVLLLSIKIKGSITFYSIIHIICWIAQFLSYKYLEKKSPALFNGLIRSFTTAPIFIVYEIDKLISL